MKNLFLLLLFISSCKSPDVGDLNPMTPYLEGIGSSKNDQEEMLKLVNAHRERKGAALLVEAESIKALAQEHAENMSRGAVAFGHAGSSRRCDILITELGPAELCGEIIARGQENADEVYSAWMKSAAHRTKIENPRYTHTGVGLSKSESGVIYWTQIFLEVL